MLLGVRDCTNANGMFVYCPCGWIINECLLCVRHRVLRKGYRRHSLGLCAVSGIKECMLSSKKKALLGYSTVNLEALQ